MPRGPGAMRRVTWETKMATLKLRVSGMTCGHCQAKVEQALKHAGGVYSAVVDPGRGGRGRLRRRRGDHRPVDCGYRAGGLPRTRGGLVRAPQVVARLHLLVHLR